MTRTRTSPSSGQTSDTGDHPRGGEAPGAATGAGVRLRTARFVRSGTRRHPVQASDDPGPAPRGLDRARRRARREPAETSSCMDRSRGRDAGRQEVGPGSSGALRSRQRDLTAPERRPATDRDKNWFLPDLVAPTPSVASGHGDPPDHPALADDLRTRGDGVLGGPPGVLGRGPGPGPGRLGRRRRRRRQRRPGRHHPAHVRHGRRPLRPGPPPGRATRRARRRRAGRDPGPTPAACGPRATP